MALFAGSAAAQESSPRPYDLGIKPDEVETYFQTQQARVNYHWVSRAMFEALDAHRPAAEAYAFLVGNMTGLSLDMAMAGPAGVAKTVGKEALFAAAKDLVNHPEKICMEMAGTMMDEGLQGYREQYRIYKKWNSGAPLTQQDKERFAATGDPITEYKLGEDLFADTIKYKYDMADWEQARNRLVGKIAELEEMSDAWDAATIGIRLGEVLDEAKSGLRSYPPYQRHLERLQQVERSKTPSDSATTVSRDSGTTERRDTPRRLFGPKHGDKRTVDLGNGVKMEFVFIGPGEFVMGSPGNEEDRSDDEGPQHKVTISRGFWLGETEVTQAQYHALIGKNPSHFEGDTNPVENVSWDDAQAFCAKLSQAHGVSARLPSEAEWEYACRAGTKWAYSFGNDADQLSQYAWFSSNSNWSTHPVKSKKANPWGLYDMHGNVWEWCADVWHDSYNGAPTDGSAWMTDRDQSRRVLRGGSWGDGPWRLRSANRGWVAPGIRDLDNGFRVALDSP